MNDSSASQPAVEHRMVPCLRFPMFTNAPEWHTTELFSVANLRKGVQLEASEKNESAAFPHFNGGITASSRTAQSNREANTTIISEGGNSCGYVQFVEEPFWCGGHCYSVHPKGKYSDRSLYYLLKASQTRVMGLRVGSGLPNIQKAILSQLELAVPEDAAELEEVANCLASLDDLIASEARKLGALRRHKNGLVGRLFPRQGEPLPHLRFPAFRNERAWESKPLSRIAENLDSKRIPITSGSRLRGKVPYYGASGIVDYVHGFIFDEDLLCVSEDGANLLSRTYPIAFSISGKAWVNNHAHVLRFDSPAKQATVETYLNAIDLTNYITGMAQPKLNRAMLDSILVPLPYSHREQQDVADCVRSLDALIALQGQKLSLLQTQKKGLVQKLFPSLEVVTE